MTFMQGINLSDLRLGMLDICFANSPLQSIESEYVLSHIVEVCQKKGEWMEEITVKDYFKEFNPNPIWQLDQQLISCIFNKLDELGYLNVDIEKQIISITPKFAELCRSYI